MTLFPNPSFPRCRFYWKGHNLTPTISSQFPVVDLSEQNITEVLTDLYPNLDVVSLSHLVDFFLPMTSLQSEINWSQLFKNNGFHYSQRFLDLLLQLSECPEEFLLWAQQKKSSFKDLLPLLSLYKSPCMSKALREIAKNNPSRSEGKIFLDWITDLVLKDTDMDKIIYQGEGLWRDQLFRLRFPQTYNSDKNKNHLADHWPSFCQYRSTRHSDQLEHNLSLRFRDLNDGLKKMESLKNNLEGRIHELGI